MERKKHLRGNISWHLAISIFIYKLQILFTLCRGIWLLAMWYSQASQFILSLCSREVPIQSTFYTWNMSTWHIYCKFIWTHTTKGNDGNHKPCVLSSSKSFHFYFYFLNSESSHNLRNIPCECSCSYLVPIKCFKLWTYVLVSPKFI